MNLEEQIKKWIEDDPESQERETWELMLRRRQDPNYVKGRDYHNDLMEDVFAAIAGYIRVTGGTDGIIEVLERTGVSDKICVK